MAAIASWLWSVPQAMSNVSYALDGQVSRIMRKAFVHTLTSYKAPALVAIGTGIVSLMFPLILVCVLTVTNRIQKKTESEWTKLAILYSATSIIAAVGLIMSASQIQCMITGGCMAGAWMAAATSIVFALVYFTYITFILVVGRDQNDLSNMNGQTLLLQTTVNNLTK